ncbi:ABC-2 type transport system permease protein [Aquimarina sp. MAR_2010_214]|uniref:ABC transporter permease subunit n=1 Tax=Aquimarina sp. MAR_2010_214 TaxID=1250026 RepID=UPI000C712453|nr:ABC transporter permease subunit [Aquimarina sp. MAR_2010_214]PKV52591.1 ABC-2 type transport system permease protein [Aquimarina sp. MAR_2010_214]
MWSIIAKKEIKQLISRQYFILLSIITWCTISISVFNGFKNYQNIKQQQEDAQKLFQNELSEKDRDPHSAAHFGTYIFKPFTSLSLYDPGVNNYSGTTYRVEAHKQSEMNFSNIPDTTTIMRFGELPVSTVFQLLIPLLIIFISFSSISKERETGTLKILFSQGLHHRSLVWGKIFGNYFIITLITLPVFICILITGVSSTELFIKAISFCIAYSIYFFIITSICVLISYQTKTSRNSLLSLLCIWILLCVIFPKLVASIAETKYPLISYHKFNKQIDHDFSFGVHEDGTYNERRKKTETKLLAQYNVDSISHLPINIDGALLQASEDYNSKIHHLRSIPISQQMERQKSMFKIAAFFTPYISIHQASMAFSGTDLYHHQDFHKNAKIYRDDFVKTLNAELTKIPKNKEHTVSTEFLKNMKKFNYEQPLIRFVFGKQYLVFISFFYWLALLIFLIEISIKKNNIL